MATKTITEHFVNTFGTDLLIAYFDPGASSTGAGRYNFASYSICDDRDWVKAIGALRAAACLFKLPIDASASVDIVMDTANPEFRTAFFVQLHRSSHLVDAACNIPAGANLLNGVSKAAVEQVQLAVSKALESLSKDLPTLSESAPKPPPKPICSVSESCGGNTSTSCPDPIGTEAACVQLPGGQYEIVCVPRTSTVAPQGPGTP